MAPNPTVGDTIVERALKLGRPSMVLICDTQISARQPPRAAPKRDAQASAFVLVPLDAPLGDDGILDALRKHSNPVTAVA